ncbi:MAG TPA: hypothetical protein VNF49_09270 [Candidatus Binataceae bacterium]|nr:hypothetical protein [Candidatus Binataceae bacterium]
MFGRTVKKDDATPASDEAEAPAAPQYITRAECNAMIIAAVNAAIDAQAIINREVAGGARDAFFSAGRLESRLAEEAEGLPKPVARCLQRSVDAMSGRVAKSFGVDRGSRRAPGQPWSR